MAGQSAIMNFGKAKAMAKGAGRELGCASGGSKNSAPTEGKELGERQKGKLMAKIGKQRK